MQDLGNGSEPGQQGAAGFVLEPGGDQVSAATSLVAIAPIARRFSIHVAQSTALPKDVPLSSDPSCPVYRLAEGCPPIT